MSNQEFDVVVVGGGPGGYVCAIRAAQLGFKTACIESRGSLGGTCLNVGCIPSKALLESSEFFDKTKNHGKDYGISVSDVQADIPAMVKRKNQIVKGLTGGIEGLFKKNKVAYFKGFGSFEGVGKLSVKLLQDQKIEKISAKHIVIATGSEPVSLKIAPFDGKTILSSTEALDLEKAPEHLVVIGGGYIGLEMGSVWRRLGSKVTVIEALPQILGSMDSGVAQAMRRIMEKQGFEFHTDTKVVGVKTNSKGAVVQCDQSGKNVEFNCDKVLVAVGRRAFTQGLNLEAVGLKTEANGKLKVDDHFRTQVPGIYALGDVIDGPMLAHKAEEEGVACAELIAGKAGHVNYKAIPGVCYTWPEVASVGLSEDACKQQQIAYKVGQFPFAANGRAKCLGDTDGFVKVVSDAKTDRILGVHMIGPRVSELIAEAVVAFEFGASAEDLARSVHAHPTLAEVVKEACLNVEKRAIHI